jgi:serine/threonine protein kinase
MPAHLDVAGLGSLTRLAAGGQGVVFRAPGVHMQYAASLVFKRYKPEVAGSLDATVLESMPAYLESLPFSEGIELLSLTAWPCRLVDAGGTVAGFVMPAIPDRFFMQMRKSSGVSREAAEFQHLLNDENFLARRQLGLTDRLRYELLREAARALSVFHRHGIAVGDLSPKNLLFAYHPEPAVYFIDCDAMRFRGRSVMPQVETPGWEVRAVSPHEELATIGSDAYKLGLLALRLLTGAQDGRDPARLPRTVPAPVRQLITAALSTDPARRPRPADWITPLDTAATAASTQPPQVAGTARGLNSSPTASLLNVNVRRPAVTAQKAAQAAFLAAAQTSSLGTPRTTSAPRTPNAPRTTSAPRVTSATRVTSTAPTPSTGRAPSTSRPNGVALFVILGLVTLAFIIAGFIILAHGGGY